jgi:N12 class adenine-specific DNA methylase
MADGPIGRARAGLAAVEVYDRLRTAPPAVVTDADREILAKWPGWGPLAPALDINADGTWAEIGAELRLLLSDREWSNAQQATYNAFYTPPGIAAAGWRILAGLGFDGGRVLEPGCGAGSFIASTPAGLDVDWVGVERDPTTARIAELLHPGAKIIASEFESAAVPGRSADAVIGNVPFGNVAVFDAAAPKEATKSLHNYFIWRSIQSLRPGGVAVLLTSRYTMDSKGAEARRLVAEDADLLGAIRLPGAALTDGGTKVVSDMLVFRRRKDGEEPADPETWHHAREVFADEGVTDTYANAYFTDHPGQVLGTMRPDRAAKGGFTLRVERREGPVPLEADLTEAADRIVQAAVTAGRGFAVDAARGLASFALDAEADPRKERSIHLDDDGDIVQIREGRPVPVDKPSAELRPLIALRDAALDLIAAESDYSNSDADLAPLRAAVNEHYDTYTAAYGPLNRATTVEGKLDEETGLPTVKTKRPRSMQQFRRDPDYATVLALEVYDPDTGEASKAEMLKRRVNRAPVLVDHVDSPAEALGISINQTGGVDFALVGRLLGISDLAAHVRCVEEGLVFHDPDEQRWMLADEYLSGNVRARLRDAQAAAAIDPGGYDRNVAALTPVIPKDLTPEQIRAELGAPWIPTKIVAEFCAEVFGRAPLELKYFRDGSDWHLKMPPSQQPATAAAWGTSRVTAYELVLCALKGTSPTVTDETDNGRRTNHEETALAQAKKQEIQARFRTWCWEDPDRADYLAGRYNERFNAWVPRQFNGEHITIPGMVDGWKPYAHQSDFVQRSIATPRALCAHPVGAGKTATMFMTAIKARELGLANKPIIVVPNHLLEQTVREGMQLFPTAKILMAEENALTAENRRYFAARVATGDWDAVVMTQSVFSRLSVHPSDEAEYIEEMAEELRASVNTAAAGEDSGLVKRLAKKVDRLRTHAKDRLEHTVDTGVCWNDLGCDMLLVDEIHYYKNLLTGIRTEGFSTPFSKRATDLDMKLGLLYRSGGRAYGFTGTPIANSLIEFYVWQKHFQPDELRQTGVYDPNAWAASYVEFENAVEITPDGGSFRSKIRPAGIRGAAQLRNLAASFLDFRTADSLGIKRPAAEYDLISVDAGPDLDLYMGDLAARADYLRAHPVWKPEKGADNMLKICSDGTKAALDLDLVGLGSDHPGKIESLVEGIADRWRQTRDLILPGDEETGVRGGLQVVFCDLGTPNALKGTQVYGKIRAGLITAGVPADRIRFVHDYPKAADKQQLFTDCRNGKVAVLLGSTDKLGVGTNIQTRLTDLWHVDAPWRPADVKQREGRGIRPGNLNELIYVHRLVTRKSFDAYRWQTLEQKQHREETFLAGDQSLDFVADVGDVSLDYGQVKAAAADQPLLTELAEVEAGLAKMELSRTSALRTQNRLRRDIEYRIDRRESMERRASQFENVAAIATDAEEGFVFFQDPEPKIRYAEDPVAAWFAAAAPRAALGKSSNTQLQYRGMAIQLLGGRGGRSLYAELRGRTGSYYINHPVELQSSWVKPDQQWRIRRAIADAIDQASDEAAECRARAVELQSDIDALRAQTRDSWEGEEEYQELLKRRDGIRDEIAAEAIKDEQAAQQAAQQTGDESVTQPAAAGEEPEGAAPESGTEDGPAAAELPAARPADAADAAPAAEEAAPDAAQAQPWDVPTTLPPDGLWLGYDPGLEAVRITAGVSPAHLANLRLWSPWEGNGAFGVDGLRHWYLDAREGIPWDQVASAARELPADAALTLPGIARLRLDQLDDIAAAATLLEGRDRTRPFDWHLPAALLKDATSGNVAMLRRLNRITPRVAGNDADVPTDLGSYLAYLAGEPAAAQDFHNLVPELLTTVLLESDVFTANFNTETFATVLHDWIAAEQQEYPQNVVDRVWYPRPAVSLERCRALAPHMLRLLHNPDPVLHALVERHLQAAFAAEPPSDQAALILEHTAEHGTRVVGARRSNVAARGILRSFGFKHVAADSVWVLPRTAGESADKQLLAELAAALRRVQFEVTTAVEAVSDIPSATGTPIEEIEAIEPATAAEAAPEEEDEAAAADDAGSAETAPESAASAAAITESESDLDISEEVQEEDAAEIASTMPGEPEPVAAIAPIEYTLDIEPVDPRPEQPRSPAAIEVDSVPTEVVTEADQLAPVASEPEPEPEPDNDRETAAPVEPEQATVLTGPNEAYDALAEPWNIPSQLPPDGIWIGYDVEQQDVRLAAGPDAEVQLNPPWKPWLRADANGLRHWYLDAVEGIPWTKVAAAVRAHPSAQVTFPGLERLSSSQVAAIAAAAEKVASPVDSPRFELPKDLHLEEGAEGLRRRLRRSDRRITVTGADGEPTDVSTGLNDYIAYRAFVDGGVDWKEVVPEILTPFIAQFATWQRNFTTSPPEALAEALYRNIAANQRERPRYWDDSGWHDRPEVPLEVCQALAPALHRVVRGEDPVLFGIVDEHLKATLRAFRSAKTQLLLTHTYKAGTLLRGTVRGDGAAAILHQHGFKYVTGTDGMWELTNTRLKPADEKVVAGLTAALRRADFEVAIDLEVADADDGRDALIRHLIDHGQAPERQAHQAGMSAVENDWVREALDNHLDAYLAELDERMGVREPIDRIRKKMGELRSYVEDAAFTVVFKARRAAERDAVQTAPQPEPELAPEPERTVPATYTEQLVAEFEKDDAELKALSTLLFERGYASAHLARQSSRRVLADSEARTVVAGRFDALTTELERRFGPPGDPIERDPWNLNRVSRVVLEAVISAARLAPASARSVAAAVAAPAPGPGPADTALPFDQLGQLPGLAPAAAPANMAAADDGGLFSLDLVQPAIPVPARKSRRAPRSATRTSPSPSTNPARTPVRAATER